jgi:GT2 family glycosyltransferase
VNGKEFIEKLNVSFSYVLLIFAFYQRNKIILQPSVAIVILNFNGKNYLEQFLPSVVASSYLNKEIIIADNASADDSVQFLKQNYPSFRILINTQNDGFAGGYNWALAKVSADYYVLLNSDVEVTPDWIEPIIELMEADKSIAACQPKLLSYYNRQSFEYAGACGGFIDRLGYPFSRGRIFDVLEKDKHQYEDAVKIFWATGAAMFVRSSVFHEMNGFDASFFAHMEEIDLCWRMQLAGYKIYVQPKSVVYHVGAGTLPRGGRKVFLNFRNNLTMLLKNLPQREKVYKIPLRFLLDDISAIKGLLNGDIGFFKAIIVAHNQIIKICLWEKCVITKNRKRLKNLDGVYLGSLVWQHFIKRKKKFSDIVKNNSL